MGAIFPEPKHNPSSASGPDTLTYAAHFKHLSPNILALQHNPYMKCRMDKNAYF